MIKLDSLILSIDFEDWYQGLTSTADRCHLWNGLEPCLGKGAMWLLEQLAARHIRATFFVVGSVAEQYPDIVRQIVVQGHEIGLHGYAHERVFEMSEAEFERDVQKNLEILVKITGTHPIGYRAPWFSISKKSPWFWTILAKCGMKYDSSVFPIKNVLYGLPDANPIPHVVETKYGEIKEFPITTVKLVGTRIPFSGGFYFRILPYRVIRYMTDKTISKGIPVISYFHPWEFVPDHQRPGCVTLRERLSHYGGLRNNRKKFLQFLSSYSFVPFIRMSQNENSDEQYR